MKKNIPLHNYNVITKIRKLTLFYYDALILKLHSSVAKCPNNILYRKPNQTPTLYLVVISGDYVKSAQFFGLSLTLVT